MKDHTARLSIHSIKAPSAVRITFAPALAMMLAGCTATLGTDGAGLPEEGDGNGVGSRGGDADGTDLGDGDAISPGDVPPAGDGDASIDNVPPPACPTPDPFVGTSIVRRLTNFQYNRTALLLFGDDSNPADDFPVETREEGYDNQASSQHVQLPQVVGWESAARHLAERATRDVDALLGCDTEALGIDACFSSALPTLVRRILRTSAEPQEVARYQSFFNELRDETEGTRAVELIIQALLLAPRFLFLIEEGAANANDTYRLDAYEVASRLSFLLWNQAPDDELLDAADAGDLDTRDGVATEARRLLADERAIDTIVHFHSQWIDLSEVDNMVVPDGFPESVKDAARKEIEWFIEDWYTSGGKTHELFTSPRSLVDDTLALLYGMEPRGGETVVELPAEQRAGLLTRAVFLSTHGIPPTRGDYVLSRVLCSPVPALTIMPPDPPDLGETATTRERFELHSEDPCAAGCHGVLDPVGFAFEHYGNTGRWRDTENGRPIDAATVLTLPEETGFFGPIDGAVDLSRVISESPLASDCLGENWFRYAHGRGATAQDDCSVEAMQNAIAGSGDVVDLLVALTQTDAFLYIRKEGR